MSPTYLPFVIVMPLLVVAQAVALVLATRRCREAVQRLNKLTVGSKTGFMCAGDFHYDLGQAPNTAVYAHPHGLMQARACVDHCGMVRVRISREHSYSGEATMEMRHNMLEILREDSAQRHTAYNA